MWFVCKWSEKGEDVLMLCEWLEKEKRLEKEKNGWREGGTEDVCSHSRQSLLRFMVLGVHLPSMFLCLVGVSLLQAKDCSDSVEVVAEVC